MDPTGRRVAEAEQRRERHGESQGQSETDFERCVESRKGVEEEHGPPLPRCSESANYRSCIGLLFEYSVSDHTNNTGNTGPR